MLALLPERLDHVMLVGAHCDDIVVGCGGTLLELCRAHPGIEVTALTFTGGGSLREAEERAALEAFCPGAQLRVAVLDLPHGQLPTRWDRIKRALEDLRARVDPGVIFGPSPKDGNQDRGMVAELIPVAFPDHLVLGYEIAGREGNLEQPGLFSPLAEPVLREKIEKMLECYGSQRDRPSFDEESFAGLARLRGVQCYARYAEAFHVSRLVLGWAALPGVAPHQG
ncbi:PIG-L deacetylase family protein [Pseudonocardia spinosispora]|uniref:PIG-L deacetylase family protein n=1 Tax=Pseudonocardia spinosispora TaxID=103441 RepID=UPI0003FAE472|nr:PIG-L family deacetylase [Pseudonocardia spinosispora]